MKAATWFPGVHCLPTRTQVLVLLNFLILLAAPARARARELANYAADMREDLADRILPYWHDTTIDRTNGGYVLADDVQGRRAATEKQIVTQSRLIWTFSRVHLRGYGDEKHNYLKAAEQGYRFLIEHFLDRKNGGYFWTTDLSGKVLNDRKILYGESFVLYALVEYYRASGDKESLRRAIDLYHDIQKRAHDPKNGGWFEHFTRDWTPIMKPDAEAIVEIAGYKSANTHLHLMEALTDLYEVTLEDEIKRSLEECLRLNATCFYPKDAGKSSFHRQPDWTEVTDAKSAGLSYGHNVEFAWLMIRAQKVLGAPTAWDHFYAHLNHALKYGYDHERGGLYSRGSDDKPATDTDKVWWVQAEMLAALTDAVAQKPNADYEAALKKLLDFVTGFMSDPTDGVWLDTVTAEGKFKNTGKAHNWKANYHDVRAMLKFIEAFRPTIPKQ
jgi:mannose/cellobiose epimerase-like protein (N-acyl-D-glucosamine 2-epimerase family)